MGDSNQTSPERALLDTEAARDELIALGMSIGQTHEQASVQADAVLAHAERQRQSKGVA